MTQYNCPMCKDSSQQVKVLETFLEEDYGHVFCKACSASYDSNIETVRKRRLTQNEIDDVDNRDAYRKLFVETWEISDESGEVYPDFNWDDNDALKTGVARHVVTSIDKFLDSKEPNILDLGCGDGFTTCVFSSLYGKENVMGLDPSPLILRTAKLENIQGIRGTLDTVAFDENQFDVVVIIGNLMLHQDMAETLAEAHRITRPGGIVVFDFKNVNSAIRKIARHLARLSFKLENHELVQRNFVNMRYGLNRTHIPVIAPSELFDILNVYDKPPRLLEFSNKSDLSKGLKGSLWRLLGGVDKVLKEQAWLQVTVRVK